MLPAAAIGIQAGASIVGGLLGRRAKRKEAKMQREIADYNNIRHGALLAPVFK